MTRTVWMLVGLSAAAAGFGFVDSIAAPRHGGGWITLPNLAPFLCYAWAGIFAAAALILWVVSMRANPNGVFATVMNFAGVLLFVAGTLGLCWVVLQEFPIHAFQPRKEASGMSRYPIRVDKKFGFIDRQGQVVIAPQFDTVSEFSDDRARVYIGSLAGYIDRQGKMVIEPKYATATDFAQHRAVVLEGTQYMVIDPAGKVISKIPYRVLGEFHQELARVQKTGEKDASGKREPTTYGYMDRDGHVVIEPKYLPAGDFPDDGGLNVGGLNKEWQYFDTNGNVIFRIPQGPRLEGAIGFHGGLLRVKEGFSWGFKDAHGEWRIKPTYDDAQDFKDGFASVESGGKWIEIDTDGKEVKRPAWHALKPISDGLRLVAEGDRMGYLTPDDKPAFAFRKYEDAKSFSCGMAAVKVDGSWGYLDRSGNLAIRALFNAATDFRDDLAWVMTNEGEMGYINVKGEFVWKAAPLPRLQLKPIEGPKPSAPRKQDEFDIEIEYTAFDLSSWESAYVPRITNRTTGEVLLDLLDSTAWHGHARLREGKVHLTLENSHWNETLSLVIDPATRSFVDDRIPLRNQPLSVLADRLSATTGGEVPVGQSVLAAKYVVNWEPDGGKVRYAEGDRQVNITCDNRSQGVRILQANSFSHWVGRSGFVPVTPSERAELIGRVAADAQKRNLRVEIARA
ncbi:MAG: WG repeat-containing protein [Bryobacteraceae bacterium]